jgi:rare lipoprotein A
MKNKLFFNFIVRSPFLTRRTLIIFLIWGWFLFLAACSTTRSPTCPTEPPRIARPLHDGAPLNHINYATVPDAIPRVEPRSNYGNPISYSVSGKRYYTMKNSTGYKARGIASWYGTKFHGQRTSSGDPYNLYGMTAAHPTLPLPTYAKVTNLDNHRTVIVKINDRGPFESHRLIDLSYTAAQKLDIVARGTGRVEVEAIDPRTYNTQPAPLLATKHSSMHSHIASAANERVYLQLGAFRSRPRALRLANQIKHLAAQSSVDIHKGKQHHNLVYRVRIGPTTPGEAAHLRKQLLAMNMSPSVVAVE